MKKIWGWIVGVVLVIALGTYIIWSNMTGTPVAVTTTGSNTGTGTTPTTTGTGTTGTGTGSGATTTGGSTQRGYKDGTYTGSVSDATYGQLQVAVTISGGKITNVAYPVYPTAGGHTMEVTNMALPQLKQEAIASQSANVAIVSGATQTSMAFQQSLAAALTQAKG